MKYKLRLSQRIEEVIKPFNKVYKDAKVTKEQKKVIDEIESLTCEMCHGLYIIRVDYDINTQSVIMVLGNNKGNTLLLKLHCGEKDQTVEIKCLEPTEYYICPFRAVYDVPKPDWKDYELTELQIPYGNDVILYKDGVPRVYIYTDVKCAESMKQVEFLNPGSHELIPDYCIETWRQGELREEVAPDGSRQQVIEYPVGKINYEIADFPIKKVCYKPLQYKSNPTLEKERLCIEIADKCLEELVPARGRARVRTKND